MNTGKRLHYLQPGAVMAGLHCVGDTDLHPFPEVSTIHPEVTLKKGANTDTGTSATSPTPVVGMEALGLATASPEVLALLNAALSLAGPGPSNGMWSDAPICLCSSVVDRGGTALGAAAMRHTPMSGKPSGIECSAKARMRPCRSWSKDTENIAAGQLWAGSAVRCEAQRAKEEPAVAASPLSPLDREEMGGA